VDPALVIRPIIAADDPQVAELIRTVMTEFGATGAGFAIHDPEVVAMTKAYAGSRSGYWVVVRGDRVVGGGGFAELAGGEPEVCELRKMYFLPEARGLGMGRRLLEQILEAARSAGFRTCYLETLAAMGKARRLYEAAGFERIDRPMGSTGHFGCNTWYARQL